jgi:hypothetical protein
MNQEMKKLVKKAFEFAMDDPEGSSLDEALTSVVEYLHDEISKDIGEEETSKLYPILRDFMDSIYPVEKPFCTRLYFLRPNSDGDHGYTGLKDVKFMIEKNLLGFIQNSINGKSYHVLVEVLGFKWFQHEELRGISILCDSWKEISRKEL